MIGSALPRRGGSENYSWGKPNEHIDQPVGILRCDMFSNLKTHGNVKASQIRLPGLLYVELVCLQSPLFARFESHIRVLEALHLNSFCRELRKQRSRAASYIDNPPGPELRKNRIGDSRSASGRCGIHVRIVVFAVKVVSACEFREKVATGILDRIVIQPRSKPFGRTAPKRNCIAIGLTPDRAALFLKRMFLRHYRPSAAVTM